MGEISELEVARGRAAYSRMRERRQSLKQEVSFSMNH